MKSFKSWLNPQPWRTVPSDDNDSYLDYIKKFQLNKDGVEHIKIMLYGPTGAGKSSFINTVETIIRGRMTCQALPDATSGDSFTTKYQTHTIKKDSSSVYPFVFVDLMGLEKDRKKGVCPEDVMLALEGHLRDGYKFNPQSPITSSDPYYNSSPTLNDKTHILVCVVPANTANILTDEHINKVREIRCAARDLGIPQIAILTKIDEACPEVDSDLKKVNLSNIIKKRTEELHTSVGIPLNWIYPVKNYHSEFCPNKDIEALTLMALKHIINLGEDFVDKN
uniref:G domain-containing protein n=1 Tax=Neogobius melanostomus TaxID=47308 RepID=A0A8C6TDX7_9GOBI